MKNNYKIGIVVADIDEFVPLKEYIKTKDFECFECLGRKGYRFLIEGNKSVAEVYTVCCGIGKVNAAMVSVFLIDMGCNYILNYGLSGGISGVFREQLVVPERFLEYDFDLTGIGYAICEKPSQKYIYEADKALVALLLKHSKANAMGTAVTGDHFVSSNVECRYLNEKFNALSCDMETAAIASVCHFANVPFACVRRISDDAADTAGEDYRKMNSNKQSMPFEIILEVIKDMVD